MNVFAATLWFCVSFAGVGIAFVSLPATLVVHPLFILGFPVGIFISMCAAKELVK